MARLSLRDFEGTLFCGGSQAKPKEEHPFCGLPQTDLHLVDQLVCIFSSSGRLLGQPACQNPPQERPKSRDSSHDDDDTDGSEKKAGTRREARACSEA